MFAFLSLACGDVSSKKLLQPRSQKLLPVFSSRIWKDSYLPFRSFIHVESVFCVWCQEMVQFHSSACGCPIFPTPSVEEPVSRTPPPPIGFFLLCWRLVEYRVEGPSLGSLFCSIGLCVCFCVSTTLSWWLQLCHRAWGPELWCHQFWFSFSTFLWLFRVFSGSIQYPCPFLTLVSFTVTVLMLLQNIVQLQEDSQKGPLTNTGFW